MMIKIMSLFLVVMAVLALFGRLRLPGRKPRQTLQRLGQPCPRCGRPKIGPGPCPCNSGDA